MAKVIMPCPSCGYPRLDRIADSCGYCEAYPEVRDEQQIEEQGGCMEDQLIANINAIIESLWHVPGVVKIEIEEPVPCDMWEKKVVVWFAGREEPGLLEVS